MSRPSDTAKVRGDDLRAAGLDDGPVMGVAQRAMPRAIKRLGREGALGHLAAVATNPADHTGDEFFAPVAERLVADMRAAQNAWTERSTPAAYTNFCAEPEPGAMSQMSNALRIPSAVAGASMPDMHQGYGLPIGGVLKTKGTIIPYAVGVDIGCRMKLSILDLDPKVLDGNRGMLEQALLKQTMFGTGAKLPKRADHAVLDDERWNTTQRVRQLRDKARAQLGTSGSGNHFVEWGRLTLPQDDLGLKAGSYLALLSHSGSRGTGATVAGFYSKLARDLIKKAHPDLPQELAHLSWLELNHDSGREYLTLMELMGDYAAACHAVIHQRVAAHLNAEVLAGVENHHNYAWRETGEDGETYMVHRKGATPAAAGELGVIPGSMAAPGFVIRGRGNPASLHSASHGAGRAMSRTAAKDRFTWQMVRPELERRGVTLLSAGIDENPFAYKDINAVMAQQTDLVDIVGRFDPRIVRMADAGERPED